jgi:HlyD family secretion protein
MKQFLSLLAAVALVACGTPESGAPGTLEYDQIQLPATAFERIAEIPVVEGQAVAAGDTVLVLESQRTRADLDAARADAARLQASYDEAQRGPRPEEITAARATLSGAQAVQKNAAIELMRVRDLVRQQLLAKAELDRAEATATSADASVRAADAALLSLVRGTRREQIDQARASFNAAQARVAGLAVNAERTRITAPRAGRVDSLPFKVGDQLSPGTPVAILLVGDRPHARVYVPQALRLNVAIGTAATVRLANDTREFAGKVRSIRQDPAFTPYYALTGRDSSRLSWLAEIELGADAANLPAGMPLSAQFAVKSTQ